MVDFLKGLSFLILPLAMGSRRSKFFEREIRKFAGEVKSSRPSHVIVEESASESDVRGELRRRGIDAREVVVVGSKWLSKCLAERRVVDAGPYAALPREEEEEEGKKEEEQEEEDGGASPARKKRVRHEVLPGSSGDSASDARKAIAGELQKLADAYAARNDTWRAYSYRNAVSAVLRHDRDIKSFQEAREIRGIGDKMASKIMEIIESGRSEKVAEVVDDKTRVLQLFCGIWGAGPATAENWYRIGHRSLRDLREKEGGKRRRLSKQQEIGLRFYDDFAKRIPRSEVESIGGVVEEAVSAVGRGRCRAELVGSYRRGRETCGDVDVMVTNAGPKTSGDILMQLTDKLRRDGYLTDDLVEVGDDGDRKYLGVFRLPGGVHRRIDVFVVAEEEHAPALLHYTGSAAFNRSLRALAASKGMTLTERGLFTGVVRKGSSIVNEGELVPALTEKDIFDRLGLEYKSPQERDH